MRKVKDTGGVKLDKVQPAKAVDLGSTDVLADARRRRAILARHDDIQQEQALITQRVNWLTGKAARLPRNSNGRVKAIRQAALLQAISETLAQTVNGTPVHKLRPTGLPHHDRAAKLLNELADT